MPIIEPDLSQVGPIKPGTYSARTVSCIDKPSASGKPMLTMEQEITVDNDVRTKTDWLLYTGKAAFKFAQYLRAVGMDDSADRLMNGEKITIDTDAFIGATFSVVIEADTYNGEPSDRIAAYLKN